MIDHGADFDTIQAQQALLAELQSWHVWRLWQLFFDGGLISCV